jgi:hypothetical protein
MQPTTLKSPIAPKEKRPHLREQDGTADICRHLTNADKNIALLTFRKAAASQ